MKTIESILTNYSGAFPNTTAVNSTGPAATDGSEYVADFINNYIASGPQILLNYAGVTPNGITESVANSQYIDALKKGFGIGPGVGVTWMHDLDPATAGYRVLLLQGQGILRAAYADLDAAVYVGDPSNPTAPYFYHADDAAGTIRNVAGAYLILPPAVNTYQKQYSQAAGDFTVTGTSSWTTTRAVLIPYQTADGAWRLRGNIVGDATGTTTSLIITISGITFKAGASQGVNFWQIGQHVFSAITAAGSNTITATFATATLTTNMPFSFDVELDAEPTWSNGFAYQNAITY